MNEAATDLDLSNAAIAENNNIGDEIGSFATTDQDAGDSHSYSLVSGTGATNNASFEIVGNKLTTKEAFDFETQNSYSVRIKTTDNGGLSYEEQFLITIVNEQEPLIRAESTNPTDPTSLGQTTTISVTIFNEGDGPLTVSSIFYPEGFSGPVLLPTIEPQGTAVLSVVFTPTEVKTYTGDLELNYNGGTLRVPVSAIGEIVTSIDPGGITERDVKLFPNPASAEVTLNLEAFNGVPVDINILTESGSGLYKAGQVKTPSHRINVSSYVQGVYIILIQSERQLVRKKLIIRR